MKKKVGLCFSAQLEGVSPLGHIDAKRPVYLRLLQLCQKKGWETYVLTRRTYLGKGVFNGVWKYADGKFVIQKGKIKMDFVYDRSGGIKFPPENDFLRVVNIRDFKVFSWDKWVAYRQMKAYMPKTFWVGETVNIPKILPKISTDFVVIKPYNGLKGIGIYIGPKEEYEAFSFPENYPKYIAQEFVDTSGGIPGLVSGMHDLRVVIINSKIVWSHIRTPLEGEYEANVARGGELRELSLNKIPASVGETVNKIAADFYKKFDNPIYSLDFGIGPGGKPYIFEINDQIGFPRWEMANRDNFLKELVENFESKLSSTINLPK